jgi:hypothetical protein
MTTAYRIPDNECTCVAPGTPPAQTRPISRLKVRSFITSLSNGAAIRMNVPVLIKGIAFDGGSGIKTVEVSDDGGRAWQEASLGKNLGRYSFREWTLPLTPRERGAMELRVRATSAGGATLQGESTWNPAGYALNVIESIHVTVV